VDKGDKTPFVRHIQRVKTQDFAGAADIFPDRNIGFIQCNAHTGTLGDFISGTGKTPAGKDTQAVSSGHTKSVTDRVGGTQDEDYSFTLLELLKHIYSERLGVFEMSFGISWAINFKGSEDWTACSLPTRQVAISLSLSPTPFALTLTICLTWTKIFVSKMVL
jgi:hypothetical protein